MNLYLFVAGNPVNGRDPSGLGETMVGQLGAVKILGDLQAAALATLITAGAVAAALLLEAAIEQTIDALRDNKGKCRLLRKEHSGVIHPDRHYWDCVYQCPGINREYIFLGTTSVLYECPEFIPNPF